MAKNLKPHDESVSTSTPMTPLQLIGWVGSFVVFILSVSTLSALVATCLVSSPSSDAFFLMAVTAFEALKTWITVSSLILLSMLTFFFWGMTQYIIHLLNKSSLSQLSLNAVNRDFLTSTDSLTTAESTRTSFVPSFDRDLDFFSSTDFEDLLVFTLDVLELLWQDVNLLVELCGDNAFLLGTGLGFMGFSWISKKVFSTKRFKR